MSEDKESVFKKIVSDDGGIAALVSKQEDGAYVLVMPGGYIERWATILDVKARVPGSVVDVSREEYEQVVDQFRKEQASNANDPATDSPENMEKNDNQVAGEGDEASDGKPASDGDGNSEPSKADGPNTEGNDTASAEAVTANASVDKAA